MSVVTVYAIFADAGRGAADRPTIVEERLAACVNILAAVPLDLSLGRRDRDATETPALFKTTARQGRRADRALKELHSYDVPAIVVWPIERLLGRLSATGWKRTSGNILPVSKRPAFA